MFISSADSLNHIPKRIISTVPSITELLYDLGLDEEVIGITKFCVHPDIWFRNKTRIGGTKQLDIDKIIALQPDLIICNKEENVQDQIEALATVSPVYLSDIKTVEDAWNMIHFTGMITGAQGAAEQLLTEIKYNFSLLHETETKLIRAAYFIWKDPYMTIGGDTFISDMMNRAGFENVYGDMQRYPEVTERDLKGRNPQVILLSSEPYPFKEKHMAILQAILPKAKIILADGEMFSWYGSRMKHAPAYFTALKDLFEKI